MKRENTNEMVSNAGEFTIQEKLKSVQDRQTIFMADSLWPILAPCRLGLIILGLG